MATAPKLTRRERLRMLRAYSPSVFRSSSFMWFWNLLFSIAGLALLVVAVLMFTNSSIGKQIFYWLMGVAHSEELSKEKLPEEFARLNKVLSIIAASGAALCFIISSMATGIRHRNWHIMELDLVAEDEDDREEKKPGPPATPVKHDPY